jgi:hypothetical protein
MDHGMIDVNTYKVENLHIFRDMYANENNNAHSEKRNYWMAFES